MGAGDRNGGREWLKEFEKSFGELDKINKREEIFVIILLLAFMIIFFSLTFTILNFLWSE